MDERKAVRVEVKGNSLCTACGASQWFVICEGGGRGNPARGEVRHCPWCGARFVATHVDDEGELAEYEREAR